MHAVPDLMLLVSEDLGTGICVKSPTLKEFVACVLKATWLYEMRGWIIPKVVVSDEGSYTYLG